MITKPVIFISAVSRELHSARDLVAKTLLVLGYEPKWQDIASTETGDLRAVLRKWVDDSAAVIQLVGHCYGFAPQESDTQFGPVSYTQYEALYARQRGKPVWHLILGDDHPTDGCSSEPQNLRELQASYRDKVKSYPDLYHSSHSLPQTEAIVLKLRDDLAQLRKQQRRWSRLVLGLLAVLVLGGAWLMHVQKQQAVVAVQTAVEVQKQADVVSQTSDDVKELKSQNDKLLAALRELPGTLGKQAQSLNSKDKATRLATAYAELEQHHHLQPGSLAKELPKFAEQLLLQANTSVLDRANALFATKRFAECETAALEAKDQALAAAGKPVQDAIAALELAGSAAFQQIHYAQALDHYRAAAALTDEKRNPLEWARVQYMIAVVLCISGKYDESESLLRRSQVVFQKELGLDHDDSLANRHCLAISLWSQGKGKEAVHESAVVLEAMKRLLGAEHPKTLNRQTALLVMLSDAGLEVSLEPAFRDLLQIYRRVLGEEDEDTLTCWVNLACALDEQGEHITAEKELRQILQIRERRLGPEHPETLFTRSNLSIALEHQGNHAEAERELRIVLELRQHVIGKNHPDIANDHLQLGSILGNQKKYAAAEQEFRASLQVREQISGPEHSSTLNVRSDLADVLDVQGKYAEAEVEYRTMLAIHQRVDGPEHPSVLTRRNNLAVSLWTQGKNTEAEGEFRSVLYMRQRVLGAEHSDTLQSYYNLAMCLEDQKKLKEALEFVQRAEKGYQKVLGLAHPDSQQAKTAHERIETKMKTGK